jgi:hypothetical protein
VPALWIGEPGSERQERSCPSLSSTISASHSALKPIGLLPTQCDRRLSSSVTSWRPFMNWGRFSSRRQKAYSSEAGLPMVSAASTGTGATASEARCVNDWGKSRWPPVARLAARATSATPLRIMAAWPTRYSRPASSLSVLYSLTVS